MTEETIRRIVIRSFLVMVLIGAALWFAWSVRNVLLLVIVSAILAAGLSPAIDAISGYQPERKLLRLPRAVAVLILYLALIAGIALIFVVIIPPLVEQTQSFIQQLPKYIEDLRSTVRSLEESYPFLQELNARLLQQLESSLGGLAGAFAQAPSVLQFALGVVGGLLSVVLVLVLTLYLIVDAEHLRRGLLAILPQENRDLASAMMDRVRVKIGAWLVGQVLLSSIIGIASFIGLLILGVPYALLLAVIAGIGELIPIAGPVLSAVPAVLVAAFVSPLQGVLTVGLYIVIQQLESNVVAPQVMRRAVDLPAAIVIISILMGAEVQGLVGAIIALPIAAALTVVLQELIGLRDRRPPHLEGPSSTIAEGKKA